MLSQMVCASDLLWVPTHNADVTLHSSPPIPQIVCDLFHYRMSILFHLFLVAQTGCMLYCLIPGKCWSEYLVIASPTGSMWSHLMFSQYRSDSTVFSLTECMWSPLIAFAILMWHHRTYVILFDPLTMLFWPCVFLASPSGGMWPCLMLVLFNTDATLCCAHRTYVILFDSRTMSIWLCLVVAAPTGSELYCLILLQCRSDSASSSSTFHRRYVVLFDPWTMTIWHCLAAPTEGGMLYCLQRLIPGQCRSDSTYSPSPLPQKVCYIVLSLDNDDLTLPRHRRSHRR